MKRIKNLSGLFLLVAFLVMYTSSNGQIIIEAGPEITPIDMVEKILGEGVAYDNVTYQGADTARGIFSNGDSTNLGLSSGVFLTSGAGYIIPGPNNSGGAGVNNGLGGHPTLNALTTGTTYDASVLEFDIIPEFDTLKMHYVFGSEEYNVITNSDVMGFFITGPNPMGGYYNDKNIAVVPGTTLPINCFNINSSTNSQYYIDNTGGLMLQYDGFTVVLTAWVLVTPCETYHLKLGIADVGDPIYDSGVFIAENSVIVPDIDVDIVLDPPGISNHVVEGFVEADVIFYRSGSENAPDTICYEISGYATNVIDYEEISDCVIFEEGEDSASIHINAFDDGIIEGEETIELIIENDLGCIVSYDTVVITILDYLDMVTETSPNTMMCTAMEVDLWVHVENGLPPYSYYWEPGGYTNDTITVSPDETTTYYVTCTDTVMQSVTDSVEVTVIPHNVEILAYSFEAVNNPQFSEDIIGEILEDSISLVLPIGSNPNGLIATFSLQEQAIAYANGELQTSGVTPNDFTNSIIYHVITPWGCMKYWTVAAHLETGILDLKENNISVYPNPAKDKVFIANAQGFDLTIINNLGEKILRKRTIGDSFSLDLSNFENGVYYFHFNNEKDWLIRKVIINQ